MNARHIILPKRLVGLLALPALLGGIARADDREHLEPRPPWIFFSQPDEKTAAEIDKVITTSFADMNKVVDAREHLVRRFGVMIVPRLVDGFRLVKNEPAVLNCELTCWALRDRVGPARELWPLLEPLSRLFTGEVEPYRRAFAALALGCFHGPDTVPDERVLETIGRVGDPAADARATLRDIGRILAAALPEEAHWHGRVAIALALAKRGDGPDGDARRAILNPWLWEDARGPESRQAVLLALGLLPGPGDEDWFLTALRHEQGQVRRAAALGLALQLLHDRPPAWRLGVERVLKGLKSDLIRPALDDGFEAVFARGVIAARANARAEWDSLYDIAVASASKVEAATAAVQCLLFCPDPSVADRAIDHLGGGAGLPDPVVAGFLLMAGRSGKPKGIAACREFLSNKARQPRGREDWDVRYHAAVGILRALASGALRDAKVRKEAVEALEAGVKRGLEAGEVRTRIERVLEHQKSVLADPLVSLRESEVVHVEGGFVCPYGLLAHEIEDVGLVRLNDMVPLLFNIHPHKAPSRAPGAPVEADKTDVPQRFLKACLDRYPYFRRIELKAARGLRPTETMQGAERHEVRNPP